MTAARLSEALLARAIRANGVPTFVCAKSSRVIICVDMQSHA
jgi:hypothetical protein